MGMSNDQSDIPGFLEARSPEDGKVLWHWDAVPKPGEPGSETWPNADTMAHGGGATWIPGSYDPDLNLIYWGTGNPHPVLAGKVRRGANLYTCSIVALNADTGKMAWYFQASPHDTQDRDANESIVLIDAEFQGKAAQASGAGQPQWILLRSRSRDRRESAERRIRSAELVRGAQPARRADSQAR